MTDQACSPKAPLDSHFLRGNALGASLDFAVAPARVRFDPDLEALFSWHGALPLILSRLFQVDQKLLETELAQSLSRSQ